MWKRLAIMLCMVMMLAASNTAYTESVPVEQDTSQRAINELTKKLDELNITSDQYYTLLLAKQIGNKYGMGKILMGITWQESRAGALGPIGDAGAGFGYRSYGICQIKRKTARLVLRLYPKLGHFATDEELISRLMTDRQFNLEMAAHVLLMLKAKGLTEAQMIQTYNWGRTIKNSAKASYTKQVRKATTSGVPAKVDALEHYLETH